MQMLDTQLQVRIKLLQKTNRQAYIMLFPASRRSLVLSDLV